MTKQTKKQKVITIFFLLSFKGAVLVNMNADTRPQLNIFYSLINQKTANTMRNQIILLPFSPVLVQPYSIRQREGGKNKSGFRRG